MLRAVTFTLSWVKHNINFPVFTGTLITCKIEPY